MASGRELSKATSPIGNAGRCKPPMDGVRSWRCDTQRIGHEQDSRLAVHLAPCDLEGLLRPICTELVDADQGPMAAKG